MSDCEVKKLGRPKGKTLEEAIKEMRKQDAERCKNYLTAADFYRMYGDETKEKVDK